MTVSLHPECEARLTAILTAVLPNAIVDHGKFLRSSSLTGLHEGNAALSANTRAQLTEWISDNPFSSFIFGVLSAEVMREFEYQSEATANLVDLPRYSDVSALAHDLLSAFKSLPWRYTLLFPLSLKAHEEHHGTTHEYRLADNASLVAPGPDFASTYPLLPAEEPMSLFLTLERDAGPRTWIAERYYLKLMVDGFIEDDVFTRPVEEASLFLRSFAGLLLSSAASVRSVTAYSLVPTESPFFTYVSDGSANRLLRSHMLPSEYAEKVQTLEWNDIVEMHGERWPASMQAILGRLSLALNATHEQSAVRRAAQWYFDSECGRSELLQFVQATVAIEILLGNRASSDVVGIAELLANRCAYLLADSHDKRERILREMKDLYSTRSAIVHRGKHRLTKEESIQLIRLQYYCKMTIARELKLLAKDSPTS